MNRTTITVGSVTRAIKAKRLLWRAGIESELIKAVDHSGTGGCAHGVSVRESDIYEAVRVLRNNGILRG